MTWDSVLADMVRFLDAVVPGWQYLVVGGISAFLGVWFTNTTLYFQSRGRGVTRRYRGGPSYTRRYSRRGGYYPRY